MSWIVACTDRGLPPQRGGEVGSVVVALAASQVARIETIAYTISGADAYSSSGQISVDDAGATFAAKIDHIPVGAGYHLQLAATEAGGAHCTASAEFSVAAGQTTALAVRLRCPGQRQTGSVAIDGEINVCAVIDAAMATAGTGRSISLQGRGSDADSSPGPLVYEWSASAGVLSNADKANATLSCPPDERDIAVTLKVYDTDCGDEIQLAVHCDRAGADCREEPVEDDAGTGDAPASEAVAYQIDPGHTGVQPNDRLRLPLAPRWTRDFGARVSYALVAGGRVFVTVANIADSGTILYGLDSADGATIWGPVELGGSWHWSNATYEAGRVFALNGDGLLTGYDAASGRQVWVTQLPGQYAFSSPPTAAGGVVYAGGAGSGGTLYAVDTRDGTVLWTASVENGDNSAPAVGSGGVFVSYACNQAYGFTARCGRPLWHYSGPCSGGGGATTALIDGLLYTRDFEGDLVLDSMSGQLRGTFASAVIPAGADGTLYTLVDGVLAARSVGSPNRIWSFGDGTLTTAPIVVGAHVVVGSSAGLVSVVSRVDGTRASSYQLKTPIEPPDEQNVSAPLAGLSAAGDQLYVPAATTLTAF